jgi:molybdopterin molybdotransferase
LFARPALRVLAGFSPDTDETGHARLGASFEHRGDRPTYHPSRIEGGPELVVVTPLDWGGSADLRTVAGADGFAVFPAGDRRYVAGEIVRFVRLG